MSHTITVTFTDAIYEALCRQARHDGQGSAPGGGVGYVVRRAVRYWLNKNGHSSADLDLDDRSYHEMHGKPVQAVPGTRKDTTPALPESNHTHEGGS